MGLSFKGGWKNTDKTDARKAATDIAKGFAEALGGPLGWAMKQVYKNGLVFEKSDKSCADAHPGTGWTCWGETVGNTITVYSNADSRSFVYNNFLVHEMGHAFDNAVGGLFTSGYGQRVDYISSGWTDMPTGNAGYACSISIGQLCPWIQGYHTEGSGYDVDQTADMFLGWVYGQWGNDISGTRRQNWMGLWMPFLLTGSAPSPNLQINCNEDTGEGCFPFGE